jgi:hypothetical protein
MFTKSLIVGLIAATAQFASADVTCIVNEASAASAQMTFDKNLVSRSVAELKTEILLQRGDMYVTATKSGENYQLSVYNIKPGETSGEILSVAMSHTLPISLIDGRNKLMVHCY